MSVDPETELYLIIGLHWATAVSFLIASALVLLAAPCPEKKEVRRPFYIDAFRQNCLLSPLKLTFSPIDLFAHFLVFFPV